MKKKFDIGSDELLLPNGQRGYLRRNVSAFGVSDPEYVKWATKRLEAVPRVAAQFDLMKKTEVEVAKFANPETYRPTQRFPIPMGIGLGPQQAMIGQRIMPEFIGGPDDRGYYPIYGREAFYVDPLGNKLGPTGTVKRLDVKVTFGTVQTYQRAIEVFTEDREQEMAAAVLNLAIDSYKLDVAQRSLAAEKEADIASAVLSTGNYAAGHYETLAASDQWSHKDSTPVEAFWDKRRTLFRKNLVDPDLFAMGGETESTLMVNKQILALSSVARTGAGRPSAPVTRDFLAALFQIEIAVGNAATLSTIDSAADPTQVWDDFAGLYITGANATIAPRWGLTVVRTGYPLLVPYRDDRPGIGGNVFKWADCWNPKVTKTNAAYLWLDTK